jgi:DNA-binding transcriptional ArsR family regulator
MTYQQIEAPPDMAAFAVLADPTRRELLSRLRLRPLAVGELARQMPVSRPAVSQHLKILREARLVREHRQGTRHYFGLDPAGFAGLREYADAMWQEALNAFASYVSEKKRSSARPARSKSRKRRKELKP